MDITQASDVCRVTSLHWFN